MAAKLKRAVWFICVYYLFFVAKTEGVTKFCNGPLFFYACMYDIRGVATLLFNVQIRSVNRMLLFTPRHSQSLLQKALPPLRGSPLLSMRLQDAMLIVASEGHDAH